MRKGKRIFLSVIIALCFLSLCSKNSPLYPMNDWVDANCFFTVGKSLIKGKVLYRDIYEQKGLYVYLVYGLASLISPNSFTGVFLFEVISFSAFLYYALKCLCLYFGETDTKRAVQITALSAFSVSVCVGFSHGGSVEELSLFMLTASLFWVLSAVKNAEDIKNYHALIIGAFAAIALWSKFTIAAFYLGLCAAVFLYYLRKKSFVRLWQNAACFIGGFCLVTVPVISYFAYHNAVGDMIRAYFYNNIILYPDTVGKSVFLKIISPVINILIGLLQSIPVNGLCGIMTVIWVIHIFKTAKSSRDEATVCILPFSILSVATLFGGKFFAIYYSLIFCAFAPLGLGIALRSISDRQSKKGREMIYLSVPKTIICTVVLLMLCLPLCRNTYLMRYPKADMPQYKFADIINREDNPTLINYGFLDGGFYTAAGIMPQEKYFCRLNLRLDEMYAEQYRAVEEMRADFIVTCDMRLEDENTDSSGYELVSTCEFPFEGNMVTYYLYKAVNRKAAARRPC